MQKAVLMLGVVVGAAGVAAGQISMPGSELAPLTIDLQGNIVSPGYGGRVVNENYDNWRAAAQGGVSNLTGLFIAGGDEIADDLAMVSVGAGWLDSMGLSVANMTATGANLTGGSGTIRFYTDNAGVPGAFISGFNFSLPAFSLAPGASLRLAFPAGALTGLNIFLPSNVHVSIQYTAASGIPLADVGMQLRGPINTGSSADQLYNVTTNSSFNFGGNPPANMALFIKTNDVPAPGAMALLAIGGLLAARRRR